MYARLHRLTAFCLVAFYGLVGLTGESLHYLAQDFGSAIRVSANDELRGYYHTHDPDHYGHFHHSHTKAQEDPGQADNSGIAFQTGEQFHSQHACPLLAIASCLKLSSSVVTPLFIQPDTSHASLREFSYRHAIELAADHQARGPPTTARLA